MTSPGSNLDLDIAGFAARLIEVSETAARAHIIAQTVVEVFPEATAIVYILQEDDDGQFWTAKSKVGDGAEPDRRVTAGAGTLGSLLQTPHAVIFAGQTLAREQYAHLNVRRTLRCSGVPPDGEYLGGAGSD